MSSDTTLPSKRPMKKVFKAPVKGGHGTAEEENKTPKAPQVKKKYQAIDSDTSVVESSQPAGDVKKVKKIKEKSLTEAEYDEIFSSVLCKTQDENYVYEGKPREQTVNKTEVKHKLSQVVRSGEEQEKKPKLELTDDSFHTPVFEDLAVKKKKKKNKKDKKDKLKKPKAQLSQVSSSLGGIKTSPSKKSSLPPISPWGSHFAKLNSQGSSFYKSLLDDSQSIVGSLFEDDDESSSGQDDKDVLVEEKMVTEKAADSESEKEDSDSDSKSSESDTEVTTSQKFRQTSKLYSKSGNVEKVLRLSKDAIRRLEMLHQDRSVGLWVYCDNKDCEKQRYLPHVTDPLDLPDKWFCDMNKDPEHNSCDKPEHGPSEEEEEYLIQNSYNAGSIVWARVEGYPWWPAMVDDCPDFETYFWLEGSLIPAWYHVVFFDDNVTRAWLKPPSIAPYIGHEKEKRFKQTKQNGINCKDRLDVAKKQAAIAASLSTYERLKTYSFISRYKKPIGNLLKSTAKGKKKESKIITKGGMKAKAEVQEVRGEKKKKIQEIGKLYQKENKTKKGQIKEYDCTTKLIPEKVINRSEKKMNDKKKKIVNCKEMLHPAFGAKINPKNEINNIISDTLAGLAEGQNQSIEFSEEIFSQSYISRKSKGEKTVIEGEIYAESLTKDDKIIQEPEKIEINQPKENLQSETILYKDIILVEETKLSQLSQKEINIKSKEDNIKQKLENIESKQSNENLQSEPILYKDMLLVEKGKLSQLSRKEDNINCKKENVTQPGSPDFDASGEIQNEEVGSTQGTVCENVNEDEDPTGIITSTSQSSNLQNASQDMFDQEVIRCGDAVVPSLSQLSLPFECEE